MEINSQIFLHLQNLVFKNLLYSFPVFYLAQFQKYVCSSDKHWETEFIVMSQIFLCSKSFKDISTIITILQWITGEVKKSNCHAAKMSHRASLRQRLHKKIKSIHIAFISRPPTCSLYWISVTLVINTNLL